MNKYLCTLMSSILVLGTTHSQASSGNAPLGHLSAIMQQAHNNGSVRVIVKFGEDTKNGLSFTSAFSNQLNMIQSNIGINAVRSIPSFNAAVYEATAVQLDALINSGYITKIQEDTPVPPTLNESIEHIGASVVHNAHYTGRGQAIAILDTGVESWHPFYANRVVEEACFSSNYSGHSATTLCPNGRTQQFGQGAAADCSATGITGCDHGTHVAGIAAGSNAGMQGVAPEANIVAVQVFSRFGANYSACGGRECVLSYSSDQLAALEWVLNNAQTNNIAAINISIGGGQYSSACNTDIRADAVNSLREKGILTVIAAGNDGYSDSVNGPGCIPSAITVGSTNDNNDTINGYSNSSSLVDIFAPGRSILSSVTGGRYAVKSGTSMATPHVAGAIAVLKSIRPTLTANQIENALELQGRKIIDGRNNLQFPRLDLFSSAAAMESSIKLAKPSGLSTHINNRTSLTLKWDPVQGAEEYYISSRYNQQNWSGFTKSVTSNSYTQHNLTPGNYQYRVRACRLNRCSVTSNESQITYITPPTPNTPNAPTAKVTGNNITVNWNAVNNANNYLLAIKYNDNDWTDFKYTAQQPSISWSDLPAGARAYKVKACYDQVCSNASASSKLVIIAPDVPSTPSARVSNSSITLQWPAVFFANNYQIAIKYNSNDWTTYRFTSNTNSITWQNLPAGTRSYKVKACYNDHCSAASTVSNSTFISLATPSTPVATLIGNTITVDWSDVTGADSYAVSIKYNSNNWTDYKYTTSNSSISWSNLNSGTRQYRVKACLESVCYGASASSNSVTN
ncbi:S8 family serine peptidase [Pseudoalteromonas sp. JBTF-M23]|uniref:S8 family serine peptidase n=1 Tax=Pseudoalteromonas caenipelagi TaxID=2726988 RepID=A0A849VAJ4_9GAMM|nr:S8 family serine peptidase [Pseudoalteromonas caenipelagi]NOU49790.1 S8 family serine peptidase [Pseudoalteromonas caenipelagi]